MRRYRKSTGKASMRASRAGVRQETLVQRAQRETSGQKPRFTSGQARNAGVAMGMMAASGYRFKPFLTLMSYHLSNHRAQLSY